MPYYHLMGSKGAVETEKKFSIAKDSLRFCGQATPIIEAPEFQYTRPIQKEAGRKAAA